MSAESVTAAAAAGGGGGVSTGGGDGLSASELVERQAFIKQELQVAVTMVVALDLVKTMVALDYLDVSDVVFCLFYCFAVPFYVCIIACVSILIRCYSMSWTVGHRCLSLTLCVIIIRSPTIQRRRCRRVTSGRGS
jgi:hypothetical protein